MSSLEASGRCYNCGSMHGQHQHTDSIPTPASQCVLPSAHQAQAYDKTLVTGAIMQPVMLSTKQIGTQCGLMWSPTEYSLSSIYSPQSLHTLVGRARCCLVASSVSVSELVPCWHPWRAGKSTSDEHLAANEQKTHPL